MQGGNLLIKSNLGFGILLKDTLPSSWGSQGFEPETFWLLDDPSTYLPTYILYLPPELHLFQKVFE